jgi:type III restriction enzyme
MNPAEVRKASGIAEPTLAKLTALFERVPDIKQVWLFGSRARGDFRNESDVDLMVDAPDMDAAGFSRMRGELEDLHLIYKVELTRWQEASGSQFRAQVERDRKVFWEPYRAPVDRRTGGATELKPFQSQSLEQLKRYLAELNTQRAQADKAAQALRAAEVDVPEEMRDFPRKAWDALRRNGLLPPAFADRPHSSRFDGAGRAVPNVCLKIPTGGGKTLLASAAVSQVFSSYLGRHAGLVLWVVPNEAIYKQTLAALSHRDHPYRQMLNVAGAGRVKILEKNSPLTRLDVESHLCVMLLMLQSAARQSKETLRFFRDRGSVLGFLPREDDLDAHWKLLTAVPNLDYYGPQDGGAQMGSIVKSSLGNVMRLMRPMVVIDEGHHAYTENALRTLDGFNPSFLLELSATPRVTDKGGSNILVDVRGTDLDAAEMIKLPIQVDVRPWNDWQSCLSAAVSQLETLRVEAERLRGETARYIRPILLVQVERTGKDLRDAGYIHAEDARAYLLQLGLAESQIAIKTSEKDELKQPENIDLLAPTCEIRAIITKQALQEGWDCPFAYVLCALAAGRNPAALTQLVGRILRQPHVAKTGRAALDSCYVLCHDIRTADVVKSIKKSLETEGMGDLEVTVRNGKDADAPKPVTQRRRAPYSRVRIFLPRVTWTEDSGERRELAYFSDVLGSVDWSGLDVAALCSNWAPDASGMRAQSFALDLSILDRRGLPADAPGVTAEATLDRARMVRSILDLVPNAWLGWEWLDAVLNKLAARGLAEDAIARSGASLIETLRVGLEAERDRLAEEVFRRLVEQGRIEFGLRADLADYEIPQELTSPGALRPEPLGRSDGRPVEKSLFEPVFKSMVENKFEADFACYLDEQAALSWWHRNVARTQYGLQGWRRDKVYPDFVFAQIAGKDSTRLVVMETKGAHLKNPDTDYKRGLLEFLTARYQDRRSGKVGELALDAGSVQVVCDLVFSDAWRGEMSARYFS